jgi:hypothetical protein
MRGAALVVALLAAPPDAVSGHSVQGRTEEPHNLQERHGSSARDLSRASSDQCVGWLVKCGDGNVRSVCADEPLGPAPPNTRCLVESAVLPAPALDDPVAESLPPAARTKQLSAAAAAVHAAALAQPLSTPTPVLPFSSPLARFRRPRSRLHAQSMAVRLRTWRQGPPRPARTRGTRNWRRTAGRRKPQRRCGAWPPHRRYRLGSRAPPPGQMSKSPGRGMVLSLILCAY